MTTDRRWLTPEELDELRTEARRDGQWMREQLAIAAWIAERAGEHVPAGACAGTLAAAEAIFAAARVPVLIPDLWPESRLELLYVPPENAATGPASFAATSLPGAVSRPVLRAIGRAVRAEFDATGSDMMHLELDSGAALFLHAPEARETVAAAAGVALLSG